MSRARALSPSAVTYVAIVIVAVNFLSRENAQAGANDCPGVWDFYAVGFSADTITAIVAAPDGRLFVGLREEGLRIYAPGPDGVYSWTFVNASLFGLASDFIRDLAIFLDELWVATPNAGISVMNLTTGAWSRMNTSNSDLPSNDVRRLTVVPPLPTDPNPLATDWSVWASTGNGAARYRFAVLPSFGWDWVVTSTLNGLPSNSVRDIAVSYSRVEDRNYTWFATDDGVVRASGGSPVGIATFGDCRVDSANRFAVDTDGDVWINSLREVPALHGPNGAGGGTPLVPWGVCQVSGPNRLGTFFYTQWSDRRGQDMSVDPAGRVWFADPILDNLGEGALHDDGRFCVFEPDLDPIADFPSAVHALGERTWFGHQGATLLSTYTPNWERHEDFASNPQAMLLTPDRAYVGFGGAFAYRGRLPGDPSVWTNVNLPALSSVTAFVFSEDDPLPLWVSTSIEGIFNVDPDTGIVETHTTADGLPSNRVTSMVSDSRDRIWAGTRSGLALRANGYWLPLTTSTSPLVSDNVRALTFDALGRLWIGTGDLGISIFDPAAKADAWSTQSIEDGLPSRNIRALATDQAGCVWAATSDSGVGQWIPTTGEWTTHDVSTGALPSDDTRAITASPFGRGRGRVWIGTERGLALFHNQDWTHYHVPGTTLATDLIHRLAADGDQLWVAAGDSIAVRNNITGPLGNFTPQISSFAPMQGAPQSLVTISGSFFDDRGPEFNTVVIGNEAAGSNSEPAPAAEIVSVTSSELVFRVPRLAKSGLIYVESHCLGTTSAVPFTVAPTITRLVPDCVTTGTFLEIRGGGFSSAGLSEVKIGSGDWRAVQIGAESQSPGVIRVRIQAGDTSGFVRVRSLSGGPEAVSPDPLQIGTLSLNRVEVQQGIQGLPLIWGKRTHVRVVLDASDCDGEITGGTIYWRKKNGTRAQAGWAYAQAGVGLAVKVDKANAASLTDGIDFVAEMESTRSGNTDLFPLSDFDGMEVVLENNGVEVAEISISKGNFNFIDIGTPLHMRAMAVAPKSGPGTPNDVFWNNALTAFGHFARLFPQPDIGWFHGPNVWISYTPIFTSVTSADLDDESDDYSDIRDTVDDHLDPGYGQIAMAMIDGMLYVDGPSGKAPYGPFFFGQTAVSFNLLPNDWNPADPTTPGSWERAQTAATVAQEACHMMGLTNEDESNHDEDNEHHSRFDEGEDIVDGCAKNRNLSFRDALLSQVGFEARVIRLDSGPPYLHPLSPCDDERPRSVMSYADNQRGDNGYLEPAEYLRALQYLQDLKNPFDFIGVGGGGGVDQNTPTLRLRGRLSISGAVDITTSYVDPELPPISVPELGSAYRFIVRAPGGDVLSETPFRADFHAHDAEITSTRFGVELPFPPEAASVELRRDDDLLWSRVKSANAPTVSLLTPNGGAYDGSEVVPISWQGSDVDGNTLQYALHYSGDDGATWVPLPQYLTGTSYDWEPQFAAPSTTARIRVRVSDGFNVGFDVSERFRIGAKAPMVFIRAPLKDQIFTEGQRVDLCAESMTAFGPNAGTFSWRVDGERLGFGRTRAYIADRIGEHVVQASVTDLSGQGASAEVAIHVVADYDGDGIPNDWELEHRHNPIQLADAADDLDNDGLTTLGEFQRQSDPNNPDSDGDGILDGDEALLGTDPMDALDVPQAGKILYVGAENVGFTVGEGQAASEPKSFWVTHLGLDEVDWSVESDVPWLDASPLSGTSPTEVEVFALPAALAKGDYDGHLVFTAPGAQGSPWMVNVHLHVVDASQVPQPEFRRGDSNDDGGIDISDPIATLNFLFANGETPPCIDAADANDDGGVDISDAIFELNHLFTQGSEPPPPPHPGCGPDPTADNQGCASSVQCG